MNIWWIDQHLAVASAPAGRFLRSEMELLALVGRANVVVSCLTPADEVDLGVVDERVVARAAGLRFCRFPIPDFGVPTRRSLIRLTHELAKARLASATVVVHCRGGRGRSPLVAAALLVHEGRTPLEAIQFVSDKREAEIPETEAQRALLLSLAGAFPR